MLPCLYMLKLGEVLGCFFYATGDHHLTAARTGLPVAGQHRRIHERTGLLAADLVGRVSGASDGVVNVDCKGTQMKSSSCPESCQSVLGKFKNW